MCENDHSRNNSVSSSEKTTLDEELNLLGQNTRGTPITTDEAQRRLTDALHEKLRSGENALIAAPTSLGKTYHVATTPWRDFPEITGGQPVIHISQTTTARNQAAEASEKAGVKYHVLRARTELCSVARGDYDGDLPTRDGMTPSEWFDRKCDRDGASFVDAHKELTGRLGKLPCSAEGLCPAFAQYEGVPRDEESEESTYDVVHASAALARLGNITVNSNVIIDERPSYRLGVNKNGLRYQIQDGITALLDARSDSEEGTYTWESLVELVKDRPEEPHDLEAWENRIAEYSELFESGLSSSERFGSGTSIHELTPAIGRAICAAVPVGNSRYCGHDGLLKVVFTRSNRIRTVHDCPDLSGARCIIGLDAHPSPRLWELNTGYKLPMVRLVSPEENQYWRTVERGLYVVQVGQYTRPLTKGWRNDSQSAEVEILISFLREKYGSQFRTSICPKGIESDVREIMARAGIDDPETMYYGSEKSRNDFTTERVGLLVGCIDPGDEPILDNLALLGLHAEPEMVEGEDNNESRAYGRGFIGLDADAADEFLKSVRETHIAQSIGRYARDGESSRGAIVYVWTDAIPEGIKDEQVPGVKSREAPKREQVKEYLFQNREWTTYRELRDEFGVSKTYVIDVCEDLENRGKLRISRGTGFAGAHEVLYTSDERDTEPRVDLKIGGSS